MASTPLSLSRWPAPFSVVFPGAVSLLLGLAGPASAQLGREDALGGKSINEVKILHIDPLKKTFEGLGAGGKLADKKLTFSITGDTKFTASNSTSFEDLKINSRVAVEYKLTGSPDAATVLRILPNGEIAPPQVVPPPPRPPATPKPQK